MRSVPAGQPDRHLDYSVGRHLDDPRVDALWTTAEDLGIVINVLIRLPLAEELETMLQRHPNEEAEVGHRARHTAASDLRAEPQDQISENWIRPQEAPR